ncbi:unnamed protein product [Alternaria alternata]
MGTNSQQSARFLPGFLVYDKVQIVVICVQELIISIIYIYETVRLLGHGTDSNGRGPLQKLLRHLIFVNIVVLILDITLLAVQFSGHYEIQTTYKTAVYSVKLKIEFSVLNRLVSIVEHKHNGGNPGIKTLSLGPWTQSRKTRLSTKFDGPGAFSKIEETSSSDNRGKDSFVGHLEIHLRQGGALKASVPDKQMFRKELAILFVANTFIPRSYQSLHEISRNGCRVTLY